MSIQVGDPAVYCALLAVLEGFGLQPLEGISALFAAAITQAKSMGFTMDDIGQMFNFLIEKEKERTS